VTHDYFFLTVLFLSTASPHLFLVYSILQSFLHSFPTRRSSDLLFTVVFIEQWIKADNHLPAITGVLSSIFYILVLGPDGFMLPRSEHTSELQSRFDLVCRLLLEKKKILL